jgi:hypothetical protein
LGAAWDGLLACGPGPNEGGSDRLVNFYTGSWGEYEWECVELSMRWMYLAWGVPPYAANGNTIVDNYATYNPDGPALVVVQNGTVGRAPQPGDVLELSDNSGGFGHTEVVTSSRVNSHGDGSVRVMTENLNSPTNGWYSLPVSKWVVNGRFGTVVDWLHNPSWSLQEPLEYKVTDGTLSLQTDQVRGVYVPVETNVADAEVVGGGGSEPAPLLVVLTTAGDLQVGYDLPHTPLTTIASGVTQFAASSGTGSPGWPTIGWLTGAGDFYTVTGNFHSATPVKQASGAVSIAIGSNSPSATGKPAGDNGPLLGYVASDTRAYVKAGSGSFRPVANGVRRLMLADDNAAGSDALEGYIGITGGARVRVGLSGPFERIAPPAESGATPAVTDLSLTTVGLGAAPFVAYTTSGGNAYAELGNSGWTLVSTAATHVAVAGADSDHGIPLLALERTSGDWFLREGGLGSKPIEEGTAGRYGLSSLVVS